MPQLPRSQVVLDQEFLNACAPDKHTADNYLLFQNYYDGKHATLMADRTRRYLQRSGILFAENFCEPVVDLMAERLAVTGFTFEDKGAEQTDAEAATQETLTVWFDGVLQRNRIDSKQRSLHATALIKGDAFLTVDFDNARQIPRFTFNRPDGIKACYSPDEPDTLDYVSKRWNSRAKGPNNPGGRPIVRLNVYWPDRVEKYFKVSADNGGGGSWERWSDAGDNAWPIPWVDVNGAPLGIPIFHFRHKPLGNPLGRSELAGVIPQQDELNKQIIDLNDIMDYLAWPQRYVTGVTGDGDDLKPGPGQYLILASETAKAGQFEAADLGQVIAAVDATISRIARRSRTPLHLLAGGNPPSGEALKTMESGLIAKVEASQTDFGQQWEDAALLALKLAVNQGVTPVAVNLEDLVLQAQWSPSVMRDEMAEAQRAQILQQLGVSTRTLLTELGYDPDQEEENKRQEADTLAQAAGGLLDGGAAPSPYGAAPSVSVPHITIKNPKQKKEKTTKTVNFSDGRSASVTTETHTAGGNGNG